MSAAPTCRYAGRDFTEDEIALIRDLIAEDPKLTRAHLSRTFCRRVGWVKPDGGLRDMMARCALLAMHRDGLIVLPPPRRPRHAPRPVVFGPESEPPLPPPPATIEAVRPLSLLPVLDRTSHNALLWKQFIARYHYLGYKPMAGAQMRYTVVDRHGAPLAMIGMAAAAWKTAPRDHAIGWSPQTRARNLHLVVNQSRLLLLPWIVIPNLGSHILSMLRRQLPGDWTQRYNVEPVLMETFVETPRFAGTIYKAANWTCIGTTSGRGRYDTKHECALTKKTSGCSRSAETGSADSTNDRNHHLLNERLRITDGPDGGVGSATRCAAIDSGQLYGRAAGLVVECAGFSSGGEGQGGKMVAVGKRTPVPLMTIDGRQVST